MHLQLTGLTVRSDLTIGSPLRLCEAQSTVTIFSMNRDASFFTTGSTECAVPGLIFSRYAKRGSIACHWMSVSPLLRRPSPCCRRTQNTCAALVEGGSRTALAFSRSSNKRIELRVSSYTLPGFKCFGQRSGTCSSVVTIDAAAAATSANLPDDDTVGSVCFRSRSSLRSQPI